MGATYLLYIYIYRLLDTRDILIPRRFHSHPVSNFGRGGLPTFIHKQKACGDTAMHLSSDRCISSAFCVSLTAQEDVIAFNALISACEKCLAAHRADRC